MQINLIYRELSISVEQSERELRAIYNAIEHYLQTVNPADELLLDAKEKYMKTITHLAKYHTQIR